MLTTLTTMDLSSVFGGCHKGGCQQQQQQIINAPPQIINNYIPAPAAPQPVPVPVPAAPRKSVDVAIDQVQTA